MLLVDTFISKGIRNEVVICGYVWMENVVYYARPDTGFWVFLVISYDGVDEFSVLQVWELMFMVVWLRRLVGVVF